MIIRDKIVYVYDIEVFPNVFHCTVKIQKQVNCINLKYLAEEINQMNQSISFIQLIQTILSETYILQKFS